MTPFVPRVSELFPGIFQIMSGPRAAHAYLICGSRRRVLIDTGLPASVNTLIDAMASIDVTPESLDLVVLSHEHVDHAGGAPHLARYCPVAAHRLAANKLALQDEFALMNKAFSEELEAFEIDLILNEGCRIEAGGITLEVLHTPGHCSGSICLLEPTRRILFSSDTIMANGIIGGVLGSGNASDYVASLQRLAMLRLEHVLPGHGRTSDQPDSDIDAGIGKLKRLIDESRDIFAVMRETGRGHDDIMRSLRDLNQL